MDPIGKQNPSANKTSPAQVRYLTDARLDFAAPVALRKSYIVASADAGSSAFLCKSLWQTGRFGAPWEYLNAGFDELRGTLATPVDQSVAATMMKRLGARSPAEYIAKLVQSRTSSNGVFGLKARFDDFDLAVEEIPELLEMLAPVTYIYVDRRDKLTQSASVLRALLASRRTPASDPASQNHYDRDLISKCLGRLERQRLKWWRWFEANKIDPAVVYYEDANADIAAVVDSCAKLLGVQNDTAAGVKLPAFRPERNEPDAWAVRFRREVERGIDIREAEPIADDNLSRIMPDLEPTPARNGQTPADSYVYRAEVQRHERQQFPAADGAGRHAATGAGLPLAAERKTQRAPDFSQLPRYHQLVGQNRQLLQNTYVLDLMSGGGLLSLATLDAGAAYVCGVDPRPSRVAAARRVLAGYGLAEDSYRFVNMDISAALNDTEPAAYDVIFGRAILERLDARQFFAQLQYLRPKHVILDTAIAAGNAPLMRFSWRQAQREFPAEANDEYTVVTTPTHDLIALLCDYFGFKWRLSENPDSGARATSAEAGAMQMQTYVLDRIG